MTNKIKITLNGQSFELPIDLNVLGVGRPQLRMTKDTLGLPRALPTVLPIQTAQSALGKIVTQSSHRRLEDLFFKPFREDLETFNMFGVDGREERISRAIVALHNRLRRLENICGVKGSSVPQVQPVTQQRQPTQEQNVPEQIVPTQQKQPVINQIDPKWVETLIKNLVSGLVPQKTEKQEEPEQETPEQEAPKEKVEKVVKPKTVAKPKSTTKAKSSFKRQIKNNS